MYDLQDETRSLMKKYQITASKKLGQNFLIRQEVVDQIIEAAQLTKEDLVIEIGPGLGTLTSRLLERSGKVIAVELDDRMLQILQDRFGEKENFELIHEDILKVPLQEKIQQEKEKKSYKQVKIVANLPYYITTPIIMKLLEERLEVEHITVMVQKEVAQRLVANPGEKLAGAITYAVHYYTEPKSVTVVPRESFLPAPEVDSEVIQLKIRKIPPIQLEKEEDFFSIIKASFMQRRKTLKNGLIHSQLFDKEEMEDLLQTCHLAENCRGENLTMEQFAQIANYYTKKRKK